MSHIVDETMQRDDGFSSSKRRRRHHQQEQHHRRLMSIGENTSTTDGQDLFSHLPDECVQAIFSFLPSSRDRCTCAAVSKKWLLLLAHMRGLRFKSRTTATNKHHEGSRCLEAKEANDARVAAMAVGTYAGKFLGKLSLRGGLSSFSDQRITDFGLQIISQSFPNLKCLALWDCFKVTSAGLACIAQCCPALEKLDISNSPWIDDNGLVPISKNCVKLSSLNIESCPLIGNLALEAFASFAPNLESISIVRCPLVGDEGVISIFSRLPRLAKVRLSNLKLGDGVLEAIRRHSGTIKTLWLDNLSKITESSFGALKPITRFRDLRHVDIKNCDCLSDLALMSVTKSTHLLESLGLEKCDRITSAGVMAALKNCSKTLRLLSLTKCNSISGRQVHDLPEDDGDYPLLDSLTLNRCDKIEDEFLSRVAPACIRIRHVGLVGLTSITDRGIASLLRRTSSSQTARVSLRGCIGITDWSVTVLAKVFGTRLRSLSLEGCRRLRDKSLEMIGDHCHELVELDVSGCGITDDGLARMAAAEHQKLEVLSLSGCSTITDTSLAVLEVMCSGLVGLNLKHCGGITSSAVDSIRTTLWWCDVLH